LYALRETDLSVIDSIKDIKDKLHVPFSIDVIILASWSMWIVMNNKIFDNQRPIIGSWRAIFLE
jgi:hypothetical protein